MIWEEAVERRVLFRKATEEEDEDVLVVWWERENESAHS